MGRLPSGTWHVRSGGGELHVPLQSEAEFPKGVETQKPFDIAPGPLNPVDTWIGLGDDYGIHGTPDPQSIGKTQSHGCVHLTNWDAQELAKMVHRGTKVEFIN